MRQKLEPISRQFLIDVLRASRGYKTASMDARYRAVSVVAHLISAGRYGAATEDEIEACDSALDMLEPPQI